MSFLKLPTELLEDIALRLFYHATLEGFALTCKTTYEISSPHLSRYNALKRWAITSTQLESSPVRNSLDLLRAIAADPDIPHFIKTLDLRYQLEDVAEEDGTNYSRDGYIADFEALRGLISRAYPFTAVDKDVDVWVSRMRLDPTLDSSQISLDGVDGTSDSAGWRAGRELLVLSLLPNVTSLTLSEEWKSCLVEYDGEPTPEALVFADLMLRARTDFGVDGVALNKLERLLPWQVSEYDPLERTGMLTAVPFMVIPSMKEIHVCNLAGVTDGWGLEFSWPDPDLQSPVTIVKLDGCCMDAGAIGDFLSHTPNLRTFSYSHATKWHGCQHHWNAGVFVRAIGDNVGGFLNVLSVTLEAMFGEVETGIVSMAEFKALEKLTLDVRLFHGPSPDSGLRLGSARSAAPGWTTNDIEARITNLLPPKIKEVELRVGSGMNEIADEDDLRDLKILEVIFKDARDLILSTTYPDLERLQVRFSAAALGKLMPRPGLESTRDDRGDGDAVVMSGRNNEIVSLMQALGVTVETVSAGVWGPALV